MHTTISFPTIDSSPSSKRSDRSTAGEQVAYLHLLSTVLQCPLEDLITDGRFHQELSKPAAA